MFLKILPFYLWIDHCRFIAAGMTLKVIGQKHPRVFDLAPNHSMQNIIIVFSMVDHPSPKKLTTTVLVEWLLVLIFI